MFVICSHGRRLAGVVSRTTVKSRGTMSNTGTSEIVGLDFEVYGKVQGVFFRKYTQEKANKLGIRGWCQNTSKGTVRGQLQGSRSIVDEMKSWLQQEGSPKSKITHCAFGKEKILSEFTFQEFGIRR